MSRPCTDGALYLIDSVLPAMVTDVWAGGLSYWAQAMPAAAISARAQINVVFMILILQRNGADAHPLGCVICFTALRKPPGSLAAVAELRELHWRKAAPPASRSRR